MVLIYVDDEIHAMIEAATCDGEPLNQGARRLLGLTLDATQPDPQPDCVGDLADLIADGLVKAGEHLLATAVDPDEQRLLATVLADGRLRATGATIYQGPRALITASRGRNPASYAWHLLTTADGRNLETLRQRQTGDRQQRPDSYGALAPLITAGLLASGDELRLQVHRHNAGRVPPIAVVTATVTDDGFFLLSDGSRHHNPSGAKAATQGNPVGAWTTWAAPDGRRLINLRDLARR
jgi:hypothetical protein